MDVYEHLLRNVMDNGVDQLNTRTGYVCRSVVGTQVKFDSEDGFPAVTTKKLAFKSVVGELLGFFRGYDNAADFRALGCKIWDQNANETPAWLANRHRKGQDDLGRIYGKQWTDWEDTRVIRHEPGNPEGHALESEGFYWVGFGQLAPSQVLSGQRDFLVYTRRINQLEAALRKLLTDPSDRGIIVSGWNPAQIDRMALRPCHMDYRFVAFENPRVLHVVMTIRSWDLFLGGPFNIAETALFLRIMARLSGFTAGEVVIQAANVHIYENHFEQVETQLARDTYPLPSLVLADDIETCTLETIPGAFTRIQPEQIYLNDYVHHPAIKADMAV